MEEIIRQIGAEPADNLAGEHSACGAVGVLDRGLDAGRLPGLEDAGKALDEGPVEDMLKGVILALGVADGNRGVNLRMVEDLAEVESLGLPAGDGLVLLEEVATSDEVAEAADTHLCHDLAGFLSNEHEVVDEVLRSSGEALPELRPLGADADRAVVLAAVSHHHAAFCNERGGGEAELISTEQRADDNVASGLHLAVDLDSDSASQAVEHQGLLGLGKSELPGGARVLH